MNLKKRTPTAIVLITLFFLLVQYGSRLLIFIVFQAIMITALLEFYNLAGRRKLHPQRLVGILAALIISLAFFFKEKVPMELALFAALLFVGAYYLFTFTRVEQLPFFSQSIAITFFGAFFLSFTLNHFYLVKVEKGALYIYFFCAIVFLGDSGAYFLGKAFGRHKMAPLASPKKTWEGSVGGIILGILGALAAQQLFLRDVELWRALVTGAAVHAAAQMSDPLESLFKRAVGVKDSSNLLPGHGGFLDRIDSFILAAPLFYYLVRYFWK